MSESNRNDPPTVAKEHAGKWIAWNRKRTMVVGSGPTLLQAAAAAKAAGERDPGFEWVPPANRHRSPLGSRRTSERSAEQRDIDSRTNPVVGS